MTKKISKYLLLLFLVSGSSLAHSITDDFTCLDWYKWDEVRKFYYVWGYRSGANYGVGTVLSGVDPSIKGKVEKASKVVGIAASVEQIVNGNNSVCSDFKNQSLPVWEITAYVIESIGGVKNEGHLVVLRKHYSQGVK